MEGLAHPLQQTALVLELRSKAVTEKLVPTKAIQRESALNTAPGWCDRREGVVSTLTGAVAIEFRSWTIRNVPAPPWLPNASHRLSGLNVGIVRVSIPPLSTALVFIH